MAWMASNLFLACSNHAAVVEAITSLLASEAHAADPEGLLGEPPPLLVSPAQQDWIAICGARAFFDDLPWLAAQLASACRCRVVCCELIGNSYALRLTTCQHGQPRQQRCTPEAAWGGATEELAEMPLYEDAELLALQSLRESGVPSELVAIGTSPLAQPPRPPRALGEATCLSRPSCGPGTVECQAPELFGDDAPVLPSGTSHDFGLMLFEDRYVEGRPSRAAVDRLLALEEALLARARRACPEAQVTLTVTYHAGAHQDLLDQELRSRGRPTAAHLERRPRAPWWQFWRHFGKLRLL